MVRASAVIVTTVLLATAAYQVALAAGALPPDHAVATQRRGRTVLAGPYRMVSALAGGVVVLAALIVAARGGLAPRWQLDDRLLTWGTFTIGAYLAVNAVTDLASTNTAKRWLGGAGKAVAAAMCIVIALAAQPS